MAVTAVVAIAAVVAFALRDTPRSVEAETKRTRAPAAVAAPEPPAEATQPAGEPAAAAPPVAAAPAPARPEPVEAAPPPELPPAATRLVIRTAPPGADVSRGEERLCATPCDIELPSTGDTSSLAISLAGHIPAELEVTLRAGETLEREVELEPFSAVEPPSKPAKRARKTRRKAKKAAPAPDAKPREIRIAPEAKKKAAAPEPVARPRGVRFGQ